MRPIYRLTANGLDITGQINTALESLTLTDKRAMEADDLSLTLVDPDHRLDWPTTGAELEVYLGFEDSGLVPMGRFTVDTIEETGPPDKIVIRALSANFANSIKQEIEDSFTDTTLGAILGVIAERNGLAAQVTPALAALPIAHLNQTTESDANLLTRLAESNDAIATVKAGNLIFVPVGHASAPNGALLPEIPIARADGDGHSFRQTDAKARYTGVRAYWHNHATGKDVAILEGTYDGEIKTLRDTFANEAEAIRAATARLNALTRARYEMSLTLAVGRPHLIANSPVALTGGWRGEITGRAWLASEVTHTLDDSGYRTSVMLEER